MCKDYSKHFLMTVEEVKNYAREKLHYFDHNAQLDCTEIGDGNINYVFKVTDKKTGTSLVIKQADALLRSSGRPLDLHRSKIEAAMLARQAALAPGMVPKLYYYDEVLCALCMEDISHYRSVRTELMKGCIFPHFADSITTFLAKTLLATTDLVLDRAEKKQQVQFFTNIELCDITEDLVLTEPYYNYKNRNIITKGNEAFVREQLYQNEALQTEVGILRNAFMNHSQALLHGDLHSGSIFINKKGIKVIDPEFACYGPIGYDIGNVIGNLFFALAYILYTNPDNIQSIQWIETTIEAITEQCKRKFAQQFDTLVHFPLYNAGFKAQYLAQILADSYGFAGAEIIRRVVGDAKVQELTAVTDPALKIPMERALILTGQLLIMQRHTLQSGSEAVQFFKQCAKNTHYE